MGYVMIKVEAGDKVKCINDETYRRQYGSGSDYSVPEGVIAGKVYSVMSISRDYFGANKLVLLVDNEEVIVNALFMVGTEYKQRFEKVDSPGVEIAFVI